MFDEYRSTSEKKNRNIAGKLRKNLHLREKFAARNSQLELHPSIRIPLSRKESVNLYFRSVMRIGQKDHVASSIRCGEIVRTNVEKRIERNWEFQ